MAGRWSGLTPVAFGLALLLFARLSNWMISDVWFDEVLTIDDYVLRTHVRYLLRSYPAPNHHVLFSVILWGWAYVIDPYLTEWFLRLPSALFSVAMVVLAVLHWRKWLGASVAIACGATLATSLVVGSFAWQLRGFSLSMLLGAVATGGMMELVDGSRRRGLMIYLPAAVLLPLVLPTNALLLAAQFAFLALAKPAAARWSGWFAGTLAPVAGAGAVGCSFYLTVWDDLTRVWAHAEGWPSAAAVVRAWATGLLAHFGPLLLLFVWQQRSLIPMRNAASPPPAARRDAARAWMILAPVAVVAGAFLLLQRPAPFPRVFLVFLPTMTFALFLACRDNLLWSRLGTLIVVGVLVLHGLGWQVVTDRLTTAALARGDRPQDLVMQYYRGQRSISRLTRALERRGGAQRLILLTDFHDFPTARYYWRAEQLPRGRLISAWGAKSIDWGGRFGPDAVPAAMARTQEQARGVFAMAGIARSDSSRVMPVLTVDRLSIWMLVSEPAGSDAPAGRP